MDLFRPIVPLIVALRTPGMKDRHWKSLPDKTECDVPEDRWLCLIMCRILLSLIFAFDIDFYISLLFTITIKLYTIILVFGFADFVRSLIIVSFVFSFHLHLSMISIFFHVNIFLYYVYTNACVCTCAPYQDLSWPCTTCAISGFLHRRHSPSYRGYRKFQWKNSVSLWT